MKLTETPDVVRWSPTHIVCSEKVGHFQHTAPLAWQSLRRVLSEMQNPLEIVKYVAFYKVFPEMIYCAGAIVNGKPENLPRELKYMHILGGKYSRFVLTGSYSNLPEACERVFKIAEETQLKFRDDFFIEHYLNRPETTSEAELITEILLPTE